MKFLDNLRGKLKNNHEDDYYDDEYMDDFQDPYDQHQTSGLLGNTSRPEANSVSVYTRSGHRVDSGEFVAAPASTSYQQQGAYVSPKHNFAPTAPYPSATPAPAPTYTAPITQAQLPPYVLRPVSYDDVQGVIRRYRTSQPVVLSFKNTNIDTAKRILDFCFGLTCGLEGRVEEIDDRVFVVLPHGMSLSQADIDNLASQGIVSKR